MFFGWRVVAGAFMGMVLVNGMFTYAFTVLVDPIRAEFGVSLEQVMYSLTLGTFFGFLVGPVMGILIDRYSVRYLMTLGCGLTAVGLYAISTAQSIGMFSLLVGITMSLSLAMVSSMSGSAAVSRWFTASRGKALGIASMGSSLGGVVVPALLIWWVSLYGWRVALQYLAFTAAVFVMPFLWLNIRSRPADMGLCAEGLTASPVQPGSASASVKGLADIIRMRSFWLIGLSMGMVFAAFSSMLANLAPYASRLGTGEAAISTMIAVLAVAGLVGKFAFGMAADRINLKYGLWVAHALLGTAFLILLAEPPYPLLLVASACFGLSTGGLLPVWNAMVARIFGVDSFGRAMGAMGPIITLSIMPAYAVVGRLFDATGDYTLGLWVFSGVIAVAAALLVPLKIEDYADS
jgi:predicted MFS family arabinose efflux permease